MAENDQTPIFQEKLWPSIGFFIATLLIIPAIMVLLMPFSVNGGIFIGIGVYLLIALIFMLGVTKLKVTNSVFNAGRATIEKKYLGEAQPLDKVEFRQEIGRKLDARAHLVLNGWVKTGIKVQVVDEADPTPYWIISTRKPQELIAALKQGAN